jgi:hypothetical protein
MRSFLFSSLAFLIVSGLSAQAAQSSGPFSFSSKASAPTAKLPAGAPGFATGLVSAGEVVSGFVPCFGEADSTCPAPIGPLEIPDPEVLVKAGGQYQIVFTLQTFASTEIFVDVVIEQNGAIAGTLVEGTLSGLGTDSLYVIYGTDPSTLPTTLTAGTAKLVAYVTDGTTKGVAFANLLVE